MTLQIRKKIGSLVCASLSASLFACDLGGAIEIDASDLPDSEGGGDADHELRSLAPSTMSRPDVANDLGMTRFGCDKRVKVTHSRDQIIGKIKAANACKPAGKVTFDRGTYRLKRSGSAPILNFPTGLSKVVIDGNGANIKIDGGDYDSAFLQVKNGKTVVIKGFTVQHDSSGDHLPFTQGTISKKIGSGNRKFEVELKAGFPQLNQGPFAGGWTNNNKAFIRDPQRPTVGKLGVRNWIVATNWTFVRGRTWQITIQKSEPKLRVGDKYVQFLRLTDDGSSESPDAFRIVRSDNVLIKNTTVHTGAARAAYFERSNRVTYYSNTTVPRAGSYMSVAATQVAVVCGNEIWIEGNRNDAVGDDAIALFPSDCPDNLTELYEIRDNDVQGRRTGILAVGNHGRIRNNLIKDTGAGAIVAKGDDVWIENNTMKRNFVSAPQNDEWKLHGIITVQDSSKITNDDIMIMHNYMEHPEHVAPLKLYKAPGAAVFNNAFVDHDNSHVSGDHNGSAVVIEDAFCDDISLDNNVFDDGGNGFWDSLTETNPALWKHSGATGFTSSGNTFP